MNDQQILAGIAEVASVHLGWHDTLEPTTRLVEDLELDSLRGLTLAVEVENRFRICLDPEVESELETVGDLVAAVRAALEEQHDPA
jgi:acyl carrier protein